MRQKENRHTNVAFTIYRQGGVLLYKKLKVYQGSQRNYKSVPKIILSGQWLEAIGFSIGNQIEVEYSDDKIIVTKVTETKEQARQKCER